MTNGRYVVAPTLMDTLDTHAEDVGDKLRVCAVGIIQAVNDDGTVAVTLSENMVLNSGSVIPVNTPLPQVPLVVMQGGGAHVKFPVAIGDECLVIFCDHNIDAWWANGGQQEPEDGRQHDIADGFCIVGPNSDVNALVTALGTNEAGLATDTAKVAINVVTGLITIANGSQNLATILAGLMTTLEAINTALGSMTTASIASGVTQTAVAAQQIELEQIAANFMELLY